MTRYLYVRCGWGPQIDWPVCKGYLRIRQEFKAGGRDCMINSATNEKKGSDQQEFCGDFMMISSIK